MSGQSEGARAARSLLRTGAAVLLAGLAALPAQAQESDLARCLAIADMAERVRCYDTLAQAEQDRAQGDAASAAAQGDVATASAASSAAPASRPAAPAAPTTPAAANPRDDFGLSAAEREVRRPTEQRQLGSIRTTISSARTVGAGYWQFATEEGSVWRMTEVRRSFRPPAAGDEVIIRRGTLGSYYIDVDNQPALPIRRVD